ncbi:phytanoyl-CoA dioxygenase family protein [Aquibaculum sediminis]|uniref:phytanoyl-CoA dioxygenase family protein n=1 Tax=Aquibaculum sediminis TaxID=3231907 RepID=UPI003451B3D3
MLSQEQVTFYHDNGYLLVEDAVTPEQLQALRQVTNDLIERSREVRESNDVYDLEEGHSAQEPRLSRIKLPHRQHEVYWSTLIGERLNGILQMLLGPDVLLQTSKLNTKPPGGGAAVEWHQDWAFYPHSNDSMLACGLMLNDVTEDNGPLLVIPGSHRGPVLSHHNQGVFCGAVDADDPLFDKNKAVTLTGRAGSMTIHHVRTLHGSAPNLSDRARQVLFYECHAADAWPLLGAGSYIHQLGQQALWDDMHQRVVCGAPTVEPRVEQVPVRMPLPPAPDATSIFKTQRSGGAKSAFAA